MTTRLATCLLKVDHEASEPISGNSNTMPALRWSRACRVLLLMGGRDSTRAGAGADPMPLALTPLPLRGPRRATRCPASTRSRAARRSRCSRADNRGQERARAIVAPKWHWSPSPAPRRGRRRRNSLRCKELDGAGEGVRTLDIQLGKLKREMHSTPVLGAARAGACQNGRPQAARSGHRRSTTWHQALEERAEEPRSTPRRLTAYRRIAGTVMRCASSSRIRDFRVLGHAEGGTRSTRGHIGREPEPGLAVDRQIRADINGRQQEGRLNGQFPRTARSNTRCHNNLWRWPGGSASFRTKDRRFRAIKRCRYQKAWSRWPRSECGTLTKPKGRSGQLTHVRPCAQESGEGRLPLRPGQWFGGTPTRWSLPHGGIPCITRPRRKAHAIPAPKPSTPAMRPSP